ncbi:hypothetical protein BGX27_003391 [Mortierella sp. AM989]|nr:hypothetical protein BGX27_003391 [Mortierella sp. AM989]
MNGQPHPQSSKVQSLMECYKVMMNGKKKAIDSRFRFIAQGEEKSNFKQLMETAWMRSYPKEAQQSAAVAIPGKVIHRYRSSGARHTKELVRTGGQSDSTAAGTLDPAVSIRMAGFTMEKERAWNPRNTVILDIELQKEIFPFVEDCFGGTKDWIPYTENIMMDRDKFAGQPTEERLVTEGMQFFTEQFLLILVH